MYDDVHLAFDHRFGLFASSPLLIFAFFYVFKKKKEFLATRETIAIFAIFIAFWIFFSGSNYTRLQFNTGIRYMSPMLPFLFVPAALILDRFPLRLIYFIAVFAVAQSWCLAMVREVEHPLGLLNPILQVFFGGFKLPALETLSRMSGGQYGNFFINGYSVIPLFVLIAALIFGIWSQNNLKVVKLKG